MGDIVSEFEKVSRKVQSYFNCQEEYLLKSMTDMDWCVWEDEGLHFLKYKNYKTPETNLVMVRRDGDPLSYRTEKYTLAIAIDCIKTGFIFLNEKELK